MTDILIGCRTIVPNGKDRYFNMKMTVEYYPTKEDSEELKEFLTPHTPNIIDDIVYIMDKGDIIWKRE